MFLKRKFNLNYKFNFLNWLSQISYDLDLPNRIWSSKETEMRQRKILDEFIKVNLSEKEKKIYETRLKEHFLNLHPSKSYLFKKKIKNLIPSFLVDLKRKFTLNNSIILENIEEIKNLD